MGIKSGPAVATLAAGMGLLDSIAEREGVASPGAAFNAVVSQIEGEVSSQVAPVVGDVLAWAVQRFGMAGVHLDAEKPFSDASLSQALSDAIGVQVGSIKDREQLKDAFRRAVTQRAEQALGVSIGDVSNREELRAAVLRVCGQKVEEFVPGLVISDLTDKQQTISDLSAFASSMLSQAVGIDFGDIRNAMQIRENAIAWALPLVAAKVEDERSNGRPHVGKLKVDRKSVLNRAAQRKFRQRWGNLRTYQAVKNG